MLSLLRLVSSMGLAVAAANIRRRVRDMARRGMLGAIGLIVFVIALCFLLVALHIWLSGVLNAVASAAIIGGVLLVFALILFFAASRPERQAEPPESPAEPLADAVREGTSRLTDALGGSGERSPLGNPVLLIAGLAVLVGFLLGRRGPRRDKDA